MVELVAHRGYAERFPENTLPALEGALTAGARYLEVDVQLTADGVPVLFHDADCLRLCGVRGSIASRSHAALKALSVFHPERFGERFRGTPLATLEDLAAFIARHPEITVFVEIKRVAMVRSGAEAAVQATYRVLQPVLAQTVLISFVPAVLVAARPLWPRIGFIATRYGELATPDVRALGCAFHFCKFEKLPRAGALDHDTPLVVYEIGDVERARALRARGVAFIETFRFAEIRAALEAEAPVS